MTASAPSTPGGSTSPGASASAAMTAALTTTTDTPTRTMAYCRRGTLRSGARRRSLRRGRSPWRRRRRHEPSAADRAQARRHHRAHVPPSARSARPRRPEAAIAAVINASAPTMAATTTRNGCQPGEPNAPVWKQHERADEQQWPLDGRQPHGDPGGEAAPPAMTRDRPSTPTTLRAMTTPGWRHR